MSKFKLWLSAKELAGVADLPKDPKAVEALAKADFWSSDTSETGEKVYNVLRLSKKVIDEVLFSQSGVSFAKGQNSDNTETWFLSRELVNVGGISDKISSINSRGRNEKWVRRKALRGNNNHMYEFHVASLPDIMVAELGFIPKIKEFLPENSDKWYTAKEIAGHEGVPKTPTKINLLANKQDWKRRVSQTGKGRRPFEYHIDSLPEATRNSILKAHKEASE
ncbi:TPA: DNA-binding protein [Vibrio parahaemolyticus]|nr:hypothetical protein [Vibrio vulnificus]